jgi:uncharacterized protein (TIGR02145 family)
VLYARRTAPHSKQRKIRLQMKKLLFLTIILSLVFTSCKSKQQIILGLTDTDMLAAVRCNLRTPGWGESLGVIRFATDTVWVISNDSITQIWSDDVTATNCQKTNFKGDRSRSYNADCRSNPNYKGDLFSWCAIIRFQDTLCPYPWRVPTCQDFIDLDIALGGSGDRFESGNINCDTLQIKMGSYLNVWGGEPNGLCNREGRQRHLGSKAFYWSQSEVSGGLGLVLMFGFDRYFDQVWTIAPLNIQCKSAGSSLRCVR